MGRKCDISDFVRGQIATLHGEGYCQREIARRLKISRCAVQNALKRGTEASGRKKCGRIRKTTPRDDRFVKSVVMSSPTTSSTSSSRVAQLAQERRIDVSAGTVRRRLSDKFNLVARRPAKKPFITQKQIQARLQFCHAMKDKDEKWWEQVTFSD